MRYEDMLTIKKALSTFIVGAFIALGNANAQPPSYAFIHKISLPAGDGKWDYLKMDGKSERLFVSHGDRVHVIDLKTERQIGKLANLKGVHGIALAEDLQKGYITNGTDNTITIFNYNTLSVLKTLTIAGKKADAILYDKGTKRIFVFNNGSGDAIAIDATKDEVIGRVTMGGAPEFAVSTEKGSIFNNNEDTNELYEIDAKSLEVKNHYSIKPGGGPTGLAYDPATNHLFSVCRNPKLLVILDAANGTIVQTVPIGGGTDAVAFDKDLKLLFVSNGEGNITIVQQVSAKEYRLVQTLQTRLGLKTLVHRETTHKLYVSGADLQADQKTPVPGTFGVFVYGPTN